MLALVAHYNLELEQMVVKTVFLHGDLDEIIYMSQPQGFTAKRKLDCVCLLKRLSYELKQSHRQQHRRFENFIASVGFIRSAFDHCL